MAYQLRHSANVQVSIATYQDPVRYGFRAVATGYATACTLCQSKSQSVLIHGRPFCRCASVLVLYHWHIMSTSSSTKPWIAPVA